MADIVGRILPRRIAGYGVVRVALAVILLMAAAMKCHQLATEPTLGSGLLNSRWFLMATVEFELFFGMWLLSGLLPRLTWVAALGCLLLFACVSLGKALSGTASCGCFGRVEVNPWYTFTLDVACVLALLRWRPTGVTLIPSRAFLLRGTVVILSWLMVGVPAAVAMGTYQPSLLGEDGIIVGDDDLIILEPEKWIGKRFPLLDFIDIGHQLAEGQWLVLLYHRDCPKCQQVIQDLPRSTGEFSTDQIALIEMPPYDDSSVMLDHAKRILRFGKLDNERGWFATTPALMVLKGGQVVAVNLTP